MRQILSDLITHVNLSYRWVWQFKYLTVVIKLAMKIEADLWRVQSVLFPQCSTVNNVSVLDVPLSVQPFGRRCSCAMCFSRLQGGTVAPLFVE